MKPNAIVGSDTRHFLSKCVEIRYVFNHLIRKDDVKTSVTKWIDEILT